MDMNWVLQDVDENEPEEELVSAMQNAMGLDDQSMKEWMEHHWEEKQEEPRSGDYANIVEQLQRLVAMDEMELRNWMAFHNFVNYEDLRAFLDFITADEEE